MGRRVPGSPTIRLSDRDRAWMRKMRAEHDLNKKQTAASIGYSELRYGAIENGRASCARMVLFGALNKLYGTDYVPEHPKPVPYRCRETVGIPAGFGQWMRKRRKELGLTQRQVAEKIRYSVAMYSAVELGDAKRVGWRFMKGITAIFGPCTA